MRGKDNQQVQKQGGMLAHLANDSLVNAFLPQLEKILSPAILGARDELLKRVRGEMPGNFVAVLQHHGFTVDNDTAQKIWNAVFDSITSESLGS